MLYLPGDFEGVSRSAILATLFVSNVGFFTETGYFAGGAETMPLLHTWSLAVEEQFYLGFPILLILVARYAARWRVAIIAGVAAISLAMAVYTQADGSGFAFYLLPPRAWELFVGALLAVGAIPALRSIMLRELVCLAGCATIGWAVFAFDNQTVFPGINALFPVLGAAALIHCAPGTVAGRILGWQPFVFIGLISYSLYLWHWPIIVFTEYATDAPVAGLTAIAVIAASFAAAIVSWRYIEQPFRKPVPFGRKQIFTGTGVAMSVVCGVSAIMLASNGWSSRFTPEAIRMAEARNDISPVRDICITSQIGGARPECTLGANVEPRYLLWGDSHGVEFAWALGENLAVDGDALVQRTRASCPPIAGYDPERDPGCVRFNAEVLNMLSQNPSIETVILSAFWESDNYATRENVVRLDRTIRGLRTEGRDVILIGPVPAQPFDVPRRLAHLASRNSLSEHWSGDRAEVDATTRWIEQNYHAWRDLGVTIIEPAAVLCETRGCALLHEGQPLYFDSHHISLSGARLVVAENRAGFGLPPPEEMALNAIPARHRALSPSR